MLPFVAMVFTVPEVAAAAPEPDFVLVMRCGTLTI